jgi:hypothetical protein
LFRSSAAGRLAAMEIPDPNGSMPEPANHRCRPLAGPAYACLATIAETADGSALISSGKKGAARGQ